jgi:hypothetical protein
MSTVQSCSIVASHAETAFAQSCKSVLRIEIANPSQFRRLENSRRAAGPPEAKSVSRLLKPFSDMGSFVNARRADVHAPVFAGLLARI